MMDYQKTYQRVWEHFNHITPFTREEFYQVSNLTVPHTIKKGELIYKQGGIPVYGGFIFKGCLRHFHTHPVSRQETSVGFAFEDYCFGDLRSIFYHEPASTSLQALEDTFIGRLDKKHYLRLFDECKPFARVMMLSMEHRYQELVNDTIYSKTEEAEERYLKMVETYPHILQRIPQHHIASYLGIKPQSLSRIRKNIRFAPLQTRAA
jgi:CRP-like cAMP-binding protein